MSVNLSTDYKMIDERISRYRYARIPLNNLSASAVTMQPTSITLLEWKLPASTVYNLKKSYIQYQWAVPALANNYAVSQEAGADFRQVYFGNGSGLGIVDLQFADQWMNYSRPLQQKLETFLTKDQLDHVYPCNQPNTSNLLPFSRDGLSTGTENAATTSYLEQQYLNISPTVNTALNLSRYFSLGSVADTMLACDKNVVFGQDMYLRLFTNLLQRMCFYTTTPANPSQNVTAITTTANMTNCYLFLCVEENINIRGSLLKALESGKIKMSIPYTYAYRFAAAGNTAVSSISLTLTKNYGRGVKKITYLPCNGQEFTNYAYDHSNVNGTKVTTVQSTIDGRPLTDYVLNCYNPYSSITPTGTSWTYNGQGTFADDWRESQKFLLGTALASYPQYQTNWFYTDSWGCIPSTNRDNIPEENIQDCLDLLHSGDHVYSLQAQTPAIQTNTSNCYTNGLINYIYVTFLRTLVIQPDGIILEA